MKKFFLILSMFFSSLLIGQNNWQKIDISSSENLNEIMFVDENIGFIFGNNGLLLKTSDAGGTWNEINTPDQNHIFSVAFISEMEGLILSGTGINSPILYKTNDGGVSWSTQSVGFGGFCFPNVLFALENKILIGGNGCFYGDAIAVYQNDTIVMDTMLHWNNSINDFDFLDDNIGFASSTRERLYKTIDGGLSWTDMSLSDSIVYINNIAFQDENIGYLVGLDTTISSYNPAVLLKTINGGMTWNDEIGQLFVTPVLTDVEIYSEDSIIAVGAYDGIFNDNGTVWFNFYNTTLDGYTEWWAADTATIKVSKNDVLENNGCIYIVGDSGFIAKNCIDTNFVFDDISVLENIANSLSLFPNPAKDFLFYEFSDIEIFHITIYDVVGKEIQVNFNIDDKIIDISKLNSGTYLLGLYTEYGLLGKKFSKD